MRNTCDQRERKAQQALESQEQKWDQQIDGVLNRVEATATSGIHISACGVLLLFLGTLFSSAALELNDWLSTYQMPSIWRGVPTIDLSQYLADYLAPASAALAALVAYVAVCKNSQPQVVVYYQPSERQQSIIELVIENVGSGSAIDVKFSKPIPIGCYGIEHPDTQGRYIPTSGIPLLAPGQRLVFHGGQFGGLLQEVGPEGIPLDIKYKFNPPLWSKKNAVDHCILSVEHFRGMATQKSMEQAVVDAIEGSHKTTIKDIRDSLQAIQRHLAAIKNVKDSQNGQAQLKDDA